MLALLRERLPEVLKAVAPLVGAVAVLQVTVVHAPLAQFLQFLAGSLLAALGMLLLFAGIDLGIVPMGRFIGAELPRKGSRLLILAVAATMGFATTVAEPDVLILGAQVEQASRGALSAGFLVYVTAAGVGVFAAAALLLLAIALGLSAVLARRSAALDGFGLLGFASVGPIIVLLLLGLLR
jgi:hypothetical protein